MLKPHLLTLSFSLLLLNASVQASSLADWIEAAFERHPDRNLVISERLVGDALGEKADQWLADDPSANIKYQTDRIGSDKGYREWEGGVDLPLWWPGQKNRYQNEASSHHGVANALEASIRLEKAGGVRERIWAVALAEAERDQAALTLEAANKLFQDVSRRVSAGELPRSDRLLAEKSVLADEDVLRRAESRLQQRKAIFVSYTGVKDEIAAQPETASTLTEIGASHPLRYLSEQRVAKARAHRNRVQGDRRSGPNVWVGAKTSRAARGVGYDDAVGIELSIPFGSVAHAAPANAEAEQALTEATTARDRLSLDLETKLQQAQLEIEATDALALRSERRKTLAEESLKLSLRAFELGETDLVRLLQAQSDANDARQSLLLSRLQYQRAIAMLNQALGVIPQ